MPPKLKKDFTSEMASTIRDIIREELKAALDTSLVPVNKCLEELKIQLSTCSEKIEELVRDGVETDVRLSELERCQLKTAKENKQLRSKIEQLENQSRKFNIRNFGLPSGIEAGNRTAFTTKLLQDLFGEEIVGTGPLLSIAHRTGQARKDSSCMIARLYRFDIKRKIIKKAIESCSFTYNGRKIRIQSDISAETLTLRATFKELKSELYKRNIRCGFIHPTATLILTFREETHKFNTAKEAQDFFDRYIEPEDEEGEEEKYGAEETDGETEEGKESSAVVQDGGETGEDEGVKDGRE
ncbi:hypothetical protein KUCAC02_007674 [Xyrichtys novacula]|uniref:Uncharacterized protein n=1 Tax=Xyrichtys novacula TaxID=13765 RepID=A0AAV1G8E9_XYRNO|nr:hypothetical protein KUCAC02_007674 [Xyrichtys novacula]